MFSLGRLFGFGLAARTDAGGGSQQALQAPDPRGALQRLGSSGWISSSARERIRI
jgi:hypothetical protein